jgi:hypothetical protein
MPAPPALLDECTDVELVGTLRARGYTVELAHRSGLRGADDEVILEYAASRGWVLISHNERHYRREHRRRLDRGATHGGIVCISQLGPIERLTIRAAMMLEWVGSQPDRAHLFTWGQLQQRLERDLTLPGFSPAEVLYAMGRTDEPG